MDATTSDPFMTLAVIALLAFLAGAGTVFLLPKHQRALRMLLGGLAFALLALDFAGFQMVPYGFGVDPAKVDGVVPISALMGPRIAFFAYLAGIMSLAINQRVKQVFAFMVVGAIVLGPRLLTSAPLGTAGV